LDGEDGIGEGFTSFSLSSRQKEINAPNSKIDLELTYCVSHLNFSLPWNSFNNFMVEETILKTKHGTGIIKIGP
jgi:hypothetical protein